MVVKCCSILSSLLNGACIVAAEGVRMMFRRVGMQKVPNRLEYRGAAIAWPNAGIGPSMRIDLAVSLE